MSAPAPRPWHIAVAADGSGRWAAARGLPPAEGQLAAVSALRVLLDAWQARSVDAPARAFLTFAWSSAEELGRADAEELDARAAAVRRFFDAFDGVARGLELRVYGRWRELLPAVAATSVAAAISRSVPGATSVLSVLLAYDGAAELLAAVDTLRAEASADEPSSDALLRRHLATGDLPPIDLIVRTGGDRTVIAGLPPWHVRAARVVIVGALWPDFGERDLDDALTAYAEAR